MTSLPLRLHAKKSAVAAFSLQAAIATRFSLPRIAPPSFIPSALVRWRASILQRSARGMVSNLPKFRISSPCAATHLTSCRAPLVLAQLVLRRFCSGTAASKPR